MPEPNPATQDSQNPTPLFDMSKAQPIPQTQSAPLFDMSKAQPIQGASQQTGEVLPADVAARHARSVADARSRGLRTDLPDDEDFMDKLRTGVGKEAVSTVSGLANLANKALPSSVQIPTEQSQIARTLPEGPLKQQQLAAAKNELTPHGVGENVGATAENVVEWMGGEEALKGLGLGAKLAKMKKVADFV